MVVRGRVVYVEQEKKEEEENVKKRIFGTRKERIRRTTRGRGGTLTNSRPVIARLFAVRVKTEEEPRGREGITTKNSTGRSEIKRKDDGGGDERQQAYH